MYQFFVSDVCWTYNNPYRHHQSYMMLLPRCKRPVSVVTLAALLILATALHMFLGGPVSKCHSTNEHLLNAIAALRRAARNTIGTPAHVDVTFTLDQIMAIVGEVPTMALKPSISKHKHTLDVCPEKYLGTVYNYPYHETNRPMQNCTNMRPFRAVLSILLNGFDYDSDDKITQLINEIAYSYPSLTVHVALPRKVQVSSKMKLDVQQHVLAKTTPAGDTWNYLTKVAKTDYIIVGRRLERFSVYARLERMVRLLSEHDDIDIVGGAVRTPDGHWHMGCYQSAMRNYTLTYTNS